MTILDLPLDKNFFFYSVLRWWFASGLYMMKLAPGTLRFTAIYGFVISASVMIFGASVGNWIDKTRRIKGKKIHIISSPYSSSLKID